MVLNKRVSFYRNATDNEGSEGTIKHILMAIRNGRYKEKVEELRGLLESGDKEKYDDEKRYLPAVTWAGKFEKRANHKIIPSTYTQLVTIDIDKLDFPAAEVAEDLFNDNHCVAAWVSPSNNGVKALFLTSENHERHYDSFQHIKEYIETKFSLDVDPSGKDLARLCFVSYDTEIRYREDATAFLIPPKADVEKKRKVWLDSERKNISDDTDFIFQVCEKWVKMKTQFEVGNRNNYIFHLTCTLNRAGVDEDTTKLLLYSNYGELGEQEIAYTVEHAYRSKADEHGSVKIMQWALSSKITRKANKSAMDEYSKLLYDRVYGMYAHNVPEHNWLSLVKFHWRENVERGFTTMDQSEFERILSLAKRDAKDDAKESAEDSGIKVIPMKQMMLQEEDRIFNSEFYTSLIPTFDDTFGGGWMRGDAYGIVGQEGTYKSVYLSAMMAENMMNNVPCLYLCMEMSMYQFICREAYREFGYNVPALLKSGQWTRKNYQTMVQALSDRYNNNLFIHTKVGISTKEILEYIHIAKEETGKDIKIVGIDGLSSLYSSAKPVEALIDNSAKVKELAKESNTAVIALCHTNSEPSKHFRSQDLKIRGGMMLRANFDATISHSLCVNKDTSNMKENDYKYLNGVYWSRLINKRGADSNAKDIIIETDGLRIRESHYRPYDLEHHE